MTLYLAKGATALDLGQVQLLSQTLKYRQSVRKQVKTKRNKNFKRQSNPNESSQR